MQIIVLLVVNVNSEVRSSSKGHVGNIGTPLEPFSFSSFLMLPFLSASIADIVLFRIFEVSGLSFSPIRLYDLTALLECPVLCMISCSTPASNRRVAAVAFREWLV